MESSICTPMRIFPCRNTRNTRKYLRPLHGQGRGLTTLQIKEGIKANYTLRSKGTSGGEGPRTHVQVLANSSMASVLSVLHANQLRKREAAFADPNTPDPTGSLCFSWGGDLLVVGIIANYAAVAADTFSSELGILSSGQPRLITSPTLRKVPRGTNGGVTLLGLGAGLLGSMIIVTASMIFLPSCSEESSRTPAGGAPWTMLERRKFMGFMVIWGALGSVLDSFLGGLFQRSVRDVRYWVIHHDQMDGDWGHQSLHYLLRTRPLIRMSKPRRCRARQKRSLVVPLLWTMTMLMLVSTIIKTSTASQVLEISDRRGPLKTGGIFWTTMMSISSWQLR
ncbi:hypothetical protein FOXG_05183 [Fusarium oxysporum f. sp. lycopersici 4287]|uniref:Transmembrane protein 19 n=1 Tax=Fusarium oxysporum f. sp. lycopersici (strain 4287 / CBS 123668 / FGSC 9935 / NRRL 34936) TaxID=426428 RepID=A0A0J9USA8_FUSO4|nr:hypothetical protein FOXG_05183 [Fusarium oxysporum f. sp. lycopersici 4287]KNB02180.1 hypothetical protein FOXG_05183 [Fusarium oxysporum f. sp. lycopersici 4287]